MSVTNRRRRGKASKSLFKSIVSKRMAQNVQHFQWLRDLVHDIDVYIDINTFFPENPRLRAIEEFRTELMAVLDGNGIQPFLPTPKFDTSEGNRNMIYRLVLYGLQDFEGRVVSNDLHFNAEVVTQLGECLGRFAEANPGFTEPNVPVVDPESTPPVPAPSPHRLTQ